MNGAEMKRNCRTTVVIPNYNGIQYLENCLDSLYAGTYLPEIIVVDNGSADAGLALLKEKYGGRENLCVVELSENTGFSNAVNVGIEKADTEFVFLLNNDTTVDAFCVEELEKVMDTSSEIFSAGAKMINMKEPEKLDSAGDFYSAFGWAFSRGKDKPAAKYDKSDRIFAACAGAAIYRKALFEKVGLFDVAHFAYLEDMDVGYRANIWGYRNVFAPKAVVMHAGSAVSGSRHNAFKVDLSARNSIYLIYKNMPLLQVLINIPFLLLGYGIKTLFFIKKGLGMTYLKGVAKGFKLSFSGEGRRKKVPFRFKNLKNYLFIQLELWFGMVRRFF